MPREPGWRRRSGDPVHAGCRQRHTLERFPWPHSDRAFAGVDVHDVEANPRRQSKALSLSDREAVHAVVRADDAAGGVADGAGGADGAVRFEKGIVVAVGDEADLVAVGLLRDGEIELARQRADSRLVERTDREERVRELILRQREEKIRLILRGIDAALEQVLPAGLLDASVVAGRHQACAKPLGARGERGELQIAVAVHARNRRAAAGVLAHEVRHDGLVELPLEIDDVVGNTQLACDSPGVVQVVDGAARAEAHFAVGVRSGVIVQLHREADDLVPLTSEQCGGDRRIDPARHGDDYTHFCLARNSLELLNGPRPRPRRSEATRRHAASCVFVRAVSPFIIQ